MNPYRVAAPSPRADRRWPSRRWALAIGTLAVGFALVSACHHITPQTVDVSAYSAELEVCRQSYEPGDCEGYLACRHEVQDRYRQPRTLYCADAGATTDGGL